MITVSVCMIVKNEHDSLDRCLKSLVPVADEIIIVDTGSTDDTKEIAAGYTDKIYDFKWTGSFSDARNYSFSLATCDYIYQADADEELDAENIERFKILKEAMLPEIDIVQMYYCNQLENNTIYSYDRELRPKLYKRVRTWEWQETIHEAVRLEPVIYDSDIDIIHRPGPGHAVRDLAAFERMIDSIYEKNGGSLVLIQSEDDEELCANQIPVSNRLIEIYAKELYIAGEKDNFIKARRFFEDLSNMAIDEDLIAPVFAVVAKACIVMDDFVGFMKYVVRAAAGNKMCSEMCCELGDFYRNTGDNGEAYMWYYNAVNETVPVLSLEYGDKIPNNALTEIGGML